MTIDVCIANDRFTRPCKQRICRLALVLAATASFLGNASVRAADETPQWRTGQAFSRQLSLPSSVLWDDSPLRESLHNFAWTQQIAVLLDRRVDPDQKLGLEMREQPVLAILQAIAVERDLQAAVVRNVVYLGPRTSTRQLRTVVELRRQEVLALGEAAKRKFAVQAPTAWPDFATPRSILAELAKTSGIEMVNLDQVPHDLWPACDLPPLSLNERLTLILHQFDLTFQVAPDANRVAVVPLPERVAVVRDYPGGASPESVVQKWQAELPDCEFRTAGSRIFVRGLIEDHETIESLRNPDRNPRSPAKRNQEGRGTPLKVFTADVPNKPLGAVLSHFASQLGLELQIDQASLRDAGVSLEQLISFRVENATFDELFEAVLTPVGCQYERQGNVLKVRAKRR